MKRGDLSNVVAPVIMIELETLLKEVKELEDKRGFMDKYILRIPRIGKKKEYEIPRNIRDYLNFIWEVRGYNITLFTFDLSWEDREEELTELLYANYVPFRKIVFCVDELDLERERFMYLFTEKEDLVSSLSHRGARHISELSEVLQ